MSRFVVNVQNPKYANEVFVWDRLEKRVIQTKPYTCGDPDSQKQAKEKMEIVAKALNFNFDESFYE